MECDNYRLSIVNWHSYGCIKVVYSYRRMDDEVCDARSISFEIGTPRDTRQQQPAPLSKKSVPIASALHSRQTLRAPRAPDSGVRPDRHTLTFVR